MIYNSPGNLGDRNQLAAVARVLAGTGEGEESDAAVTPACINARSRLRPLVPALRRIGLWRVLGPGGVTAPLWYRLFPSDPRIEAEPELIVSRLGKSEHASVALADWYGVPNVHVGEPQHVPESMFRLIVATGDDRPGPNRVFLETVPSHLDEGSAARAAADLRASRGLSADQPLWCLLIGGDGGGFRYRDRDWEALAAFVRASAAQQGVRWVLSTSRRTGERAERILRRGIGDDGAVAHATWWATEPQGMLDAYIGASELCFVTIDSQSMISNCVAMRRPVYAFRPDEGTGLIESAEEGPARARVERFAARLAAAQRIRQCQAAELAEPDFIAITREDFRIQTPAERWDTALLRRARELGIVPDSARPAAQPMQEPLR